MSKNIQIPQDLFILLLRHFLLDDDLYVDDIKSALQSKLDSIVRHNQFTAYKSATDPTEREKLRQEYLDMVGISKSFRTDVETSYDTL